MGLRSLIRKLVCEVLEEADLSLHIDDERLLQRFLDNQEKKVGYEVGVGNYIDVGTKSIPQLDKDELIRKLEIIKKYNFPKNKSYAVKLLDLYILPETIDFYSPESKLESKNKTLVYMDTETKSYGNIVYLIIRNNVAVTMMFVPSYATLDNKKFRVDVVIKSFDNIVQKKIR